jgi:squalene-hopene/tetraprenyl-beta-curcumene cyclase
MKHRPGAGERRREHNSKQQQMYRLSPGIFTRHFISILGFVATGGLAVTGAEDPTLRVQLAPPGNPSLRNEVRHAIDKGAAWLEQSQGTNGAWSTPDHPALTALALVALKGRPADRQRGDESAAVQRGFRYLMSCVQPDGGIYKKEMPSYNTSVSLMGLIAANRPEALPAIVKARKFLIGLQADFDAPGKADDVSDGGFGYGNQDRRPDLSNTSLALEALYHSQRYLADKNVTDAGELNWAAAIHFVQCCQNLPSRNPQDWVSGDPKDKGGFVYMPGRSMAGGETNATTGRVALRSYGSMSYAGLLSYIYADLKRDDPRVTAAMDWLRANFTVDENPAMGPQGLFYYYHTMAKALTICGVDSLETRGGPSVKWREALALKLINLQKADGSWSNDNGRWWEKDPALVTAYALIALELIHNGL